MTKQEKVAAWMEGMGFFRSRGIAWMHNDIGGDITPQQATFFYDVMVEARIDELFRVPVPELPSQLVEYKVQRHDHLKQEGKK